MSLAPAPLKVEIRLLMPLPGAAVNATCKSGLPADVPKMLPTALTWSCAEASPTVPPPGCRTWRPKPTVAFTVTSNVDESWMLTSCETELLAMSVGTTRPLLAGSRSLKPIEPLKFRWVPVSKVASRMPTLIDFPARFEVTSRDALRWVGVAIESGARKTVVVPGSQPMVAATSSVAATFAVIGSMCKPMLWPTVPKSKFGLSGTDLLSVAVSRSSTFPSGPRRYVFEKLIEPNVVASGVTAASFVRSA